MLPVAPVIKTGRSGSSCCRIALVMMSVPVRAAAFALVGVNQTNPGNACQDGEDQVERFLLGEHAVTRASGS